MELKDKLKILRQEKGLTQKQLAEALFVSRSTVAKWENGLGLPNPDSMATLEQLFQISQEEVSTTEPEAVIVQKNKTLHHIRQAVGWIVLFGLMIFTLRLPFLIHEGEYGYTWDMAAGIFADNSYIDTGDVRVYYTSFEGEWEDGRHWALLSHFKVVQHHFWGYTVWNEDISARHIFEGTNVIGRFYSIKGKNGYYNVIHPYISNYYPDYIVTLQSVSIGGTVYDVQQGFFFVTPEPVEFFWVDDLFLNVE